MHNYHNMQIYSRSLDLAAEVYRVTQKLPPEEAYGLVSQTRRAAVSVALNIAEGSGATSNKEFARFLDIARRSLYETNACFEVAQRLNLLYGTDCGAAVSEVDQLGAMISAFKKQLQQRSVTALAAVCLSIVGLCSVLWAL